MASDNEAVGAKQNDEGAIPDNLDLLRTLPRGWAIIFLDMLAKVAPGTKLAEVREELGSLRVEGPPEYEDEYRRCEARSLETCRVCGDDGHRRQTGRGWYMVLCDECAIGSGIEHPLSTIREDPPDLQERLLQAAAGSETPDEVEARNAGVLDVEARRREKAAARANDEADLNAGRVSREELGRRNSIFGGFPDGILRNARVTFPEKE